MNLGSFLVFNGLAYVLGLLSICGLFCLLAAIKLFVDARKFQDAILHGVAFVFFLVFILCAVLVGVELTV